MAQKKAVFPTVFHHVSWNFLCHVVWGFPSWYPCGPIFKTNWAIEHVTLNCLCSTVFGVFCVIHVATRPDRKHPLAVWITLWEVHLFEIKDPASGLAPSLDLRAWEMKVVGVCLLLPLLLVLMETPTTSQSPVPMPSSECGAERICEDGWCYRVCRFPDTAGPDCSGFPGDDDCHNSYGRWRRSQLCNQKKTKCLQQDRKRRDSWACI